MAGPGLADRIGVVALVGCDSLIVWPSDGSSSRDLSTWPRAATPARVLFRWLDEKPARLIAKRRGPLQAGLEVLSSGPTPGTTSPHRKEHHVAMPIAAEEYALVIGVDTHAAATDASMGRPSGTEIKRFEPSRC